MRYDLGVSSAAKANDFAVDVRRRQIIEHVPVKGKSILDIGCGNGLYTLALAGLAKESVGVDIGWEALTEAEENKVRLGRDTEFVRALAESLPFAERSFDIVLAIEVLEHVRSEEGAMQEAGRVLKDRGWLVVYVPNKLYPFETHGLRIRDRCYSVFHGSVPFLSWAPEFIRRRFAGARIYSRKQIVRLVEGYGFVVQDVDYMYPPLDKLGSELARGVLRKMLAVLESNRLLRRFGMSVFIVARKGTG